MGSLKASLPKTLKTPRMTLELREESDAHYDIVLAVMNSPTAHARMGDFGIRTKEQFRDLELTTRLSPNYVGGKTVDCAVAYIPRLGHDGGPLMGCISLAQRARTIPPDMGWAFAEEYHGQGYATEAAKEVLRLFTEDLGITEIIAWPGVTNQPSIGIAQRIGFVEAGIVKDNEGKDALVYILPGMKFDKNMVLSIRGDAEAQ